MKPRIQGMGWATPFGRDLNTAWRAIRAGESVIPDSLVNPFKGEMKPVYRVPSGCLGDVLAQPRLRRSSTISHLAMAAAVDAMERAGGETDDLAIVFAATNGGVVYTRRFFAEVSTSGVQAGSPLLFPETVYNAPASHIAAKFGVTGVCTSIVNDATAGIDAFGVATELLECGACDRCLVVGAEELDWVIGESYGSWSLATRADKIEPFGGQGTIFAEGAAAVLLGREGGPAISNILSPRAFRSRLEGRRVLQDRVGEYPAPGLVVSSASGTKFDEVEAGFVSPRVLMPKVSLGEVFATSSIQQVICAALGMEDNPEIQDVFVLATGFSAQSAGLRLSR